MLEKKIGILLHVEVHRDLYTRFAGLDSERLESFAYYVNVSCLTLAATLDVHSPGAFGKELLMLSWRPLFLPSSHA